jgi:hypothetical protein
VVRRRPPPGRSRRLALVAVLGALLAFGGAYALPLQVTHQTETFLGVQAPTQFLTHWQQVGSVPGTVPLPAPGVWSGNVATPSRLTRGSGAFAINPSTSGDLALVWYFNETPGITPQTEIELTFHIQYTVGTVTSLISITSYIESQRRALAGSLAFTIYWDSGALTGVTFDSQLEVAQACLAIGTCS